MSALPIDLSDVDIFMPMNLFYDDTGTIVHAGPTLLKLAPHDGLVGKKVTDAFRINTYSQLEVTDEVPTSTKLSVCFEGSEDLRLKAMAVPIRSSNLTVMNMSFGLSIVDAVRNFGLSVADFAHTDLAVEMLYLVEAKSTVLEEIKQLNARLQGAKTEAEEQALTDTLTGLKNRRALDLVLDRLINSKVHFALVHLDLDYFKAVNDTYGHAAGDAVLERVAAILREETRDDDLVARVGGDEFILVFNKLVDHQRLLRTAYRIISRLEEPVVFQDVTCRISGSLGIATSDFYARLDADQMMHDADLALYASKHAGRATATVFDPTIHDESLANAPSDDQRGQAAPNPDEAPERAGDSASRDVSRDAPPDVDNGASHEAEEIDLPKGAGQGGG